MLLVVLLGSFTAASAQPDDDPADGLSPEQRQELATLGKILKDEASPFEIRKQMAGLLLNKNLPAAEAILVEVLKNKELPTGRLAVVETVAALPPNGNGHAAPDAFVDPLFDALGDKNESLRKGAARALVVYKGRPDVLDRLRQLMLDPVRPVEQRRGAMSAFSLMPPSRSSIDPLIQMLNDEDAHLRERAMDALNQLTLIRINNAAERQAWWNENKHRSRDEWLDARNQHLTGENLRLRQELQQAEKRLVDALTQLYRSTAEPQQKDRVASYLSDPLPTVRILGLQLVDQHMVSKQVPESIRKQVLDLLADESPRVRAAAADVVPYINEPTAVTAVLEKLNKEKDPAARLAMIKALGRLRGIEAAPVLIKLLDNGAPRQESAEAALALGSIAARGRLDETATDPIAKALVERYSQTGRNDGALREALLTAMADIAAPRFSAILIAGLSQEESASIRLVSARGLGSLAAAAKNKAPIIEAVVGRLSGEPDRGVRLELIGALGQMGPGQSQLQALNFRKDPTNEDDELVRKKAWETLVELLKSADKATQLTWVKQLGQSRSTDPAATGYLVELMLSLEQEARAESWTDAELLSLLEQTADLLAAKRPADAATRYLEIYRKLAADNTAPAPRVADMATRTVNAMLAANQAAQAIALMAERKGDNALADAMLNYLAARTKDAENGPSRVLELIAQIRKQVPESATAPWAERLTRLADEARKAVDMRMAGEVSKALDQMTGDDEVLSAAARKQIEQLGLRAVPALLDELEKAIDGSGNQAAREKAIISLLSAPPIQASDYDPKAPPEKRKTLVAQYRLRLTENRREN